MLIVLSTRNRGEVQHTWFIHGVYTDYRGISLILTSRTLSAVVESSCHSSLLVS